MAPNGFPPPERFRRNLADQFHSKKGDRAVVFIDGKYVQHGAAGSTVEDIATGRLRPPDDRLPILIIEVGQATEPDVGQIHANITFLVAADETGEKREVERFELTMFRRKRYKCDEDRIIETGSDSFWGIGENFEVGMDDLENSEAIKAIEALGKEIYAYFPPEQQEILERRLRQNGISIPGIGKGEYLGRAIVRESFQPSPES